MWGWPDGEDIGPVMSGCRFKRMNLYADLYCLHFYSILFSAHFAKAWRVKGKQTVWCVAFILVGVGVTAWAEKELKATAVLN